MQEKCSNFEEGVLLYQQGEKYNSPKLKTSAHHRGYAFEERRSRCGYLFQTWNLPKNYRTSTDLRTLFV